MAAAKEGAWAAFLIAGITGAVALLSVFGLSALAAHGVWWTRRYPHSSAATSTESSRSLSGTP
jgi:hypothetical protein